MQIVTPELPSTYDMPISEARFRKLEERVDKLGERIATLEGAAAPKNVWLPTILPAVAVIGIVMTFGLHLDNKIETLQKDMGSYGVRLGKVEDAIKVLGDQQSNEIQKLVHDLLSSAKEISDPLVASRAVEASTVLITKLRQDKHPADAQFFDFSVNALNSLTPTVRSAAFKSRIALAEYRSVLEPVPEWGTKFSAGKPMEHALIIQGVGNSVNGMWLDGGNVTGSVVQIGHPLLGKLSENTLIYDTKISNGTQSLDGFHWRDVVFVGVRVRYAGGEVELSNVRFVNCTFDFVLTPHAERVADYAALLTPHLTIG